MPVFSPQTMLESTWYHYKQDYLEPGTLRALDKQRNNVTTSEGQSYTLLRAVWMDDKETFDPAWQWTKDNLQHTDDKLLSWLFGERPDGTYGVLTDEGGQNAATDADVDTALALLFASKRWNDSAHFGDAILLIRDIWEKEVITIDGRPYLLANNLDKDSLHPTALVNPSYFAPYAYRIFAQVDPEHDWLSLVDTSYEVLEKATHDPLDTGSAAGLPPDWIQINKTTADISAVQTEGLTTNYGYDALRTPWRIALDAEWFQEPRAYQALRGMSYLEDQWKRDGSLASSYTHAGEVVSRDDSHAMYGGAVGAFLIINPEEAKQLYRSTLESLYDSSTFTWEKPLSYYDANWVWFGLALSNKKILNLYPTSPMAYAKAFISLNLLSRPQ